MPESKPDVIAILEPNFGNKLDTMTQVAPVWIIDTTANNPAIQRLRQERQQPDHTKIGAITSFSAQEPEARTSNLLDIIADLEIHHGQANGPVVEFPDGFVLRVIGAELSPDGSNALRDFGFTSFEKHPDGFEAKKTKVAS